MDPIQALVEEYNEYVSSNKENTARASHLKNIIDALKSEGLIHKTRMNCEYSRHSKINSSKSS